MKALSTEQKNTLRPSKDAGERIINSEKPDQIQATDAPVLRAWSESLAPARLSNPDAAKCVLFPPVPE